MCGWQWLGWESCKGFVAGGEGHRDAMEIVCLKDMTVLGGVCIGHRNIKLQQMLY